MADAASARSFAAAALSTTTAPRHAVFVRVTHWITALCFIALLVSGVEIVISHPRFYWGEAGNVLTPPLFTLPIPASRSSVPTGYNFVLPDQNGWSRYLHFQTAWILVFTGLLYVALGLATRHFWKHLVPDSLQPPYQAQHSSYNALQRLTYLFVIFVLFPLMIWTGLAMSPAIAAVFPFTVTAFGGQQSARTIHFFGTWSLVLFLFVHVVMVCRAGFRKHTGAMITGRTATDE